VALHKPWFLHARAVFRKFRACALQNRIALLVVFAIPLRNHAIMLIGYARVPTGEQDTAVQSAALKTAGCELIFRERASGGRGI
jgi:hypothetical protein